MKRLPRLSARAAVSALVVATAAIVPVSAPPAFAALSSVGPIAETGFPSFYADSAGTQLELCVDGVPPCFTGRPDLTSPPSATNLPTDGEAFYYIAEASIDRPGAPLTFMRLAVEATYADGAPGAPATELATFARVRFRIFGLVPGASYTVAYPYGTKTFTADTTGRINDTEDIGCFPAGVPCADMPPGAGFDAALHGGVGNFLQWDPAVGPPAPAGYIGSFGSPHPVVGSPVGQNFFRITGTNIGGVGVNTVQTNLFDVAGKLSTGSGTVALAPGAVTFADTQVGALTTAQNVTLANNTTSPTTVASVGLSGGNIDDFRVVTDGCTGRTLAPATSCAISTRFQPVAGGIRSTTLRVVTNAANSPHSTTLTGRGMAPGITTSPLRIDFSKQKVGTSSAARTVTVTSSGTENLTISSVDLVGGAASDFVLVGDSCGGVTLTPTQSCTAQVTFDPSVAGVRSTSLAITSNAPLSPQLVPLVGTGTAPSTSFSPSSLNFGSQLLLIGNAEQTVTLQNKGNAPLTITGFSITGANATDFSIATKTCGPTLAAGAKCAVAVRFSPTFLGVRSATLELASDVPAGNPTNVPLSGRGSLIVI